MNWLYAKNKPTTNINIFNVSLNEKLFIRFLEKEEKFTIFLDFRLN